MGRAVTAQRPTGQSPHLPVGATVEGVTGTRTLTGAVVFRQVWICGWNRFLTCSFRTGYKPMPPDNSNLTEPCPPQSLKTNSLAWMSAK